MLKQKALEAPIARDQLLKLYTLQAPKDSVPLGRRTTTAQPVSRGTAMVKAARVDPLGSAQAVEKPTTSDTQTQAATAFGHTVKKLTSMRHM